MVAGQHIMAIDAGDTVMVQGHRMLLDDVDSLCLRSRGVHEPGVTKIARENVKDGDVVLDIGAHIGYFTLIFAELVGPYYKNVIAFEPNPEATELLCENTNLNNYNNRVTVFRFAVWDKWDEIKLWLNCKNKADHRCWNPGRPWKWIWANTINLDCLTFDHIDFIKMDIQGAEYRALLGMQKLLQDNPQVKMIMEFAPAMLEACGPGKPGDCLDLLTSLGFRLWLIEETGNLKPVDANWLIEHTPHSRFRNIYCER
jgi:FkbM family methyltransferase